MDINARDILTRGEKAALKREIRDYVKDMISEEMYNDAAAIGRKWIKNNKSEIDKMVEEVVRKEVNKFIKGIIVQHRGY